MKSRGKNTAIMKAAMELLLMGKTLPEAYKDHQRKGDWKVFRELHHESDWILVYRGAENTVYFTRTGTHADLFSL